MRFNSTLVRLKVDPPHRNRHQRNGFQFHTGSIKRQAVLEDLDIAMMFQFHTGSIKSLQLLNTSDELA